MDFISRIINTDGELERELGIMALKVAPEATDSNSVKINNDGRLALGSRFTTPYRRGRMERADTMAAGDVLRIREMPNIRNNCTINFRANIVTSGEILLTFGTTAFNCGAIKVNSTSIFIYNTDYDLDYGATGTTYNHDLTFTDFVDVIIKVGADKNATISLYTNGGSYTTPQAVKFRCGKGNVEATINSGSYTGCVLNFTGKCFTNDIWFFYDSYGDHLKLADLGITDFTLDSWSGRGTRDAYMSLIKDIELAMPKIIVWGIGMNDPDSKNGAASSINNTYKTYTELAKKVADENSILFIPVVIPNTPTYDNTLKNAWIKENFDYYIDLAQVFGAEEFPSSWFAGLKRGDNSDVHPSEAGDLVMSVFYAQMIPTLNR